MKLSLIAGFSGLKSGTAYRWVATKLCLLKKCFWLFSFCFWNGVGSSCDLSDAMLKASQEFASSISWGFWFGASSFVALMLRLKSICLSMMMARELKWGLESPSEPGTGDILNELSAILRLLKVSLFLPCYFICFNNRLGCFSILLWSLLLLSICSNLKIKASFWIIFCTCRSKFMRLDGSSAKQRGERHSVFFDTALCKTRGQLFDLIR